MSLGIGGGLATGAFFLGIMITSVVTWRAGIYPRGIAIALAVTAMLGLLTRLVMMPAWLGMNIIPALFTTAMAWLGVVVVRTNKQVPGRSRSKAASRSGTRPATGS
jgi:hypothetical protein